MHTIDMGPAITDRLVICPSCNGFMRFAHTVPCGKNLPDMQTFECSWCSLSVTAEQALEVLERPMF